MIKKVLKIGGIVLASMFGIIVLLALGTKVYLNATYFNGYDPDQPLESAITDLQEREDYMRASLYFNGLDGLRVPTLMATPKDDSGPWPCVMFLHGIGQNKKFLDEIAAPFVRAGFAFCSFDQLMQGERKIKSGKLWDEAKAFIRRPKHTVIDTRRLIDYLETRNDIAHDRIYLAGASYGAITGSTAAAMDKRIPAVVLTYGGGNIPKMLTARMVAQEIGNWLIPAQIIGSVLLGASDPVRYAGDIAPRPVYLQNGTDDGLIATDAAKALQNAVKEPKKIQWYEGDHIGFDAETVRIVLNDIVEWLKEQDAKITHQAAVVGNEA